MNASLFSSSLDKMLDQLKHLSDGDIGNEIDGLSGKPVGGVEITKVESSPLKMKVGSELDNFDPHSTTKNNDDPGNDYDGNDLENDGDEDDPLTNVLSEINKQTGEHPDMEWIKSTGRDPHSFLKQFSSSEMDNDDDDASFPDERIAKILGNKRV